MNPERDPYKDDWESEDLAEEAITSDDGEGVDDEVVALAEDDDEL
jgi:hypothetical protein